MGLLPLELPFPPLLFPPLLPSPPPVLPPLLFPESPPDVFPPVLVGVGVTTCVGDCVAIVAGVVVTAAVVVVVCPGPPISGVTRGANSDPIIGIVGRSTGSSMRGFEGSPKLISIRALSSKRFACTRRIFMESEPCIVSRPVR